MVAEAITRLEAQGFALVGLKLVRASAALAAQHHAPLVADRNFRSIVARLAGARVSALAFEGAGVVEAAKALVGDAASPAPDTLRGAARLAETDTTIASASLSPAAAQRELCLWFSPSELVPPAPAEGAPAKGEKDAELNFAIAAASAAAASAGDVAAGVDGGAASEKVQKRDKVRAALSWPPPSPQSDPPPGYTAAAADARGACARKHAPRGGGQRGLCAHLLLPFTRHSPTTQLEA